MLRLRLWKYDESKQFDIELYENAPVNLKYQFADITEINKSVGSYSQTFRVPYTKKNQNFFEGLTSPNVKDTSGLIGGNFSLKKKIRAELSYSTIPMMSGYVQVKAIYRQKKKFNDIELVFFGESVDLASSVGGSLMSDLSLSSLDVTLNFSNIINSLFSLAGFPLDGTLRFGIMDKGRNWGTAVQYDVFGNVVEGLWPSINPLKQIDFTPYVQIKYLFTKILSEAGFEFESDFMDTNDFENIYTPLYNGDSFLGIVSDNVVDNRARIGLASNLSVTNTTYVLAPFLDSVDNALNPASTWSNTNKEWTSASNQTVKIDVLIFARNVEVYMQHKNASGTVLQNRRVSTPGGSEENLSLSTVTTWDVSATDTIDFVYKKGTHSTSAWLYGDNTATGSAGSNVFFITSTDALTGFDIDAGLNMPKIKQIDFIAGLQKKFNLVFVPDKVNPKKLLIEPFVDYVASGTKKDWTSKIDFTKDLALKGTADIQASKYQWTDSAGQDFISAAVVEQLGRVYGRKETLDAENDFATGEKTITSPFAPYIMSVIPNTYVPIHRCLDQEGNGVKNAKMRLAYWGGAISSMPTYYVSDDTGTSQLFSLFPFFSNYSNDIPNVGDNDLNFGIEQPLIPSNSHPLNNLYYKYWSSFVNELYSVDARTLECYMFLTSEDIASFKFNDQIYIEDTYYRILQISGFDATTTSPCKVKLLKVLSAQPDCADIPTDVSEGVVTFNGSATDYGSIACCVKYGYTWTPDKAGGNSRCRVITPPFEPPSL